MNLLEGYTPLLIELKKAVRNKDYGEARRLNDEIYNTEYENLEKWKGVRSCMIEELNGVGIRFELNPQEKILDEEKSKLKKSLLDTDETIKESIKLLDSLVNLGILISQNTPKLNQGEETN